MHVTSSGEIRKSRATVNREPWWLVPGAILFVWVDRSKRTGERSSKGSLFLTLLRRLSSEILIVHTQGRRRGDDRKLPLLCSHWPRICNAVQLGLANACKTQIFAEKVQAFKLVMLSHCFRQEAWPFMG